MYNIIGTIKFGSEAIAPRCLLVTFRQELDSTTKGLICCQSTIESQLEPNLTSTPKNASNACSLSRRMLALIPIYCYGSALSSVEAVAWLGAAFYSNAKMATHIGKIFRKCVRLSLFMGNVRRLSTPVEFIRKFAYNSLLFPSYLPLGSLNIILFFLNAHSSS